MTNQDQEQQPVGGFIFYRSFRDAIRQLPKNKQLALYDAICDYALDGTVPDLSGNMLRVMWTLMKPSLDHTKKTTRSGPPRRGAPVGNRNASKHKDGQPQDEQPPAETAPPKKESSVPYASAPPKPQQPPRPPKGSSREAPPLHREIAEMSRDQAWMETVCMLLHLKPEQLAPYFSMFRLECETSGKLQHDNISDCKQHFKSWLRIQIEKKNRNEQSEQQNAKRRRIDVPPPSKTDYHSSL